MCLPNSNFFRTMMCFCSMKAVAKATALCLFAILAVGMVLSPLSAQTDSSRLPMKSLTVGNRWVCVVSEYFPYFYRNLTKYSRIFETVIGDTLVDGKRFAKVLSSFDNSIRYERSTDTAVYVWTSQNGEQLQYSWNFDSTKSVQWNAWTIFPKATFIANVRTWLYTSIKSAVYTENTVLFNYFESSNYTGFNTTRMAVGYRKLVGLDSVFSNGDFSTIRGNYTREAKLIGAFIDGQAIGDTAAAPYFMLSLPDTSLVINQGQKTPVIALPLVWDGVTEARIRSSNFTRGFNITYDSTIIQSVQFVYSKANNILQDTTSDRRIVQEYNRSQQGSIVTLSVFVPLPNADGRRMWMVCTVKPPSSDTTVSIVLSEDSTANQVYLYAKILAVTRNGRIKISLPSLQMSIGVSKLEARNYDTVRVPIITTGVKARYLIDSTPLPASLSFNASLLEPIGNIQVGTVTNGIRTVPFTFALTPNSDTARAVLLFRAAVGNDTATVLTPRIEPQSGINYRTTVTNGYVRIRANQAGGEQVQFFSKAPRLRVLAISPNPASDIISVTLSASEKTSVTLSLLNTLGQKIRQMEITLQTDSQEIPFSVRDVPHGVYMIVIQSQSETLTRQIQILP